MATTSTLPTIRRRLIDELGFGNRPEHVGLYATTFDSATATTVVHAVMLRDSKVGPAHYQGLDAIIHRLDSATAADNYRPAGSLAATTGAITINGANYADITASGEALEIWLHGVRADQHVHPAINRAMEFIYFDTLVAISHGGDLDYDMALSTEANWTDVGTVTTTKGTTARRTPYGLRSYRAANGAANGGTRSATIPITQGRSVRAYAIASADVGTASFRPYDITNSAEPTNAAITHSEEEPQLMVWEGAMPATCKEMALSMLGTTATSDIYWNQAWVYKTDNHRINLPAYANEHYKIPLIFMGVPRQSNGTGYYDAQSIDFIPLVEGRDFYYLFSQPEPNPNAIFIPQGSRARGYPWPLFCQVRRPHRDLGDLSAETDGTTGPLHYLIPQAKIQLLESVYQGRLPQERWSYLRRVADGEWRRANEARPISRPARTREVFHVSSI